MGTSWFLPASLHTASIRSSFRAVQPDDNTTAGRTITSHAVLCLVSRHPALFVSVHLVECAPCVWIWFNSETPCACNVKPLDQTLQILLDSGLVVRQCPCAAFGGKECVLSFGKCELHLVHSSAKLVVSCHVQQLRVTVAPGSLLLTM